MNHIDESLNIVSQKIANFNHETKLNLKLHVEHELETHKKILPKGFFYGAIHEQIEAVVDEKMDQFTKTQNIDFKPKELYGYLAAQLKTSPTLSKQQLHYLAFEHLAQNSDSKFLKKIFNKLRKGTL